VYSDDELDEAVAARVMSAATAAQFRSFVARRREAPAASEEYVRLLTSFNDIFVTAALMLAMVGTALFLAQLFPSLFPTFAATAGLAWLGAEYFTRRRKLALPSFFLFLAFVAGVPGIVYAMLAPLFMSDMVGVTMLQSQRLQPVVALAVAAAALGACALHWYRFRVPVSVAAGALGAGAGALLALHWVAPATMTSLSYGGPLLIGLALFGLAMWWDMSDVYRQTRRADVAFWLHLAAAAVIVHSTFGLIGVSPADDAAGAGGALVTILLYLFFCLVALAIDRRAILVSSLVYVLYAFSATLSLGGSSASLALTVSAIILGSGLLSLSVWWGRLRHQLLARLPAGVSAQLPRAQLDIHGTRPVA
jgi:hypothetical protein